MSATIVINPNKPATIIIGKAQTAGVPIIAVKPTGTGGGGCKAVEQYLLIPSAIGLETITPSDIAAKWQTIYANPSAVPDHSSQPLLTIQTDKQDSALEQQYNIADTIQVVTMSSQEIKDKFNDIYQTLR